MLDPKTMRIRKRDLEPFVSDFQEVLGELESVEVNADAMRMFLTIFESWTEAVDILAVLGDGGLLFGDMALEMRTSELAKDIAERADKLLDQMLAGEEQPKRERKPDKFQKQGGNLSGL